MAKKTIISPFTKKVSLTRHRKFHCSFFLRMSVIMYLSERGHKSIIARSGYNASDEVPMRPTHVFIWNLDSAVLSNRLWSVGFTSLYYLATYLWLYNPSGSWPFFQFLYLYTGGKTPWTGISPSQGRYLHIEQPRINATHPCLEWDSNPLFHCSSGRRQFMP
jgi:hypothetical protein